MVRRGEKGKLGGVGVMSRSNMDRVSMRVDGRLVTE
jgi:hypothetical protein